MITFLPTAPADWTAMSADGRLLLLDGAAPTEIASAVRASFDQSAAFAVLLDALLQGGLASAPDFVLLEWTAGETLSDVRALVRGEADVEIGTVEGVNVVTGRGVSTWTEQSFAAASGLTAIVASGRWRVAGAGESAIPRARAAKASSAKAAPAVAPDATPARAGAKETQKPTLGGAAAAVPAVEVQIPAESAVVAAPVASPAPAAPPAAPVAAATAPEVNAAPPAPGAMVPDTEATIIPQHMTAAEPAVPVAEPAADDSGYDHLFGDTVFVTVSGAAVREPVAEEDAAASAPAGDHDGHTVLTSDIAAMRAAQPGTAAAPSAPRAVAVAQRVVLEFSGGTTEVLDRPIIVGRSPSAGKVSGNEVPKLVTIGGDDPDISRSHARFAIQGGTVVVTDLNSRNGTLVTLPGKSPQRLRGGEPTSVITGTIVDLGGGIVLTVRED